MGIFSRSSRVLMVAAALCVGTASQAESVTLDTLLDGGTVTSGSLTFSEFSYLPFLNAPLAQNIGVMDIDGGIGFGTPLLATGTEAIDLVISFKVTSASPITSIGLASTADFGGNGQVAVIENVSSNGVTFATFSNIFDKNLLIAETTEDLGAGYTELFITKDIGLAAKGGFAALSDFRQTFTFGDANVIPTPSAAAAGCVALIGFAVRRRRAA